MYQIENILISDTKQQHCSQVLELEGLVTSMKEELRKQTVKFKEHVDKLVMSDAIIEQLLIDNDQLTSRLINVKNSHKRDV